MRFKDLPSSIQHHAYLVFRDTLGTMLAGASLPEVKSLANDNQSLAGVGGATVLGRLATASPQFAALVNGAGGVSLELDEGNQFAVNHPAIHVIPAALALAEDIGSSGDELLSAIIAGYEVAVRVGKATKLRDAIHPFGTHAIVGTAAACARLLKMNADQMREAMELAAGLSIASSQTAANSGASVRNLFTGFTNHNGILAARMATAGFTPEHSALEVVFGSVLGTSYHSENLEDLGDSFYITRNYFKMYACSRWNHAPIEAAAAIMATRAFEPSEIERVIVWTYDPATRLNWQEPSNGYAAKHSIPYNVAARIVLGHNDLEAYTDETVAGSDLRDLARRVEVREDPDFTAMLPEVRPARVEIRLVSGKTLEDTVERPRGGFDHPFTEDELAAKFRKLAKHTLRTEAIADLEGALLSLQDHANLDSLSAALKTSQN